MKKNIILAFHKDQCSVTESPRLDCPLLDKWPYVGMVQPLGN